MSLGVNRIVRNCDAFKLASFMSVKQEILLDRFSHVFYNLHWWESHSGNCSKCLENVTQNVNKRNPKDCPVIRAQLQSQLTPQIKSLYFQSLK